MTLEASGSTPRRQRRHAVQVGQGAPVDGGGFVQRRGQIVAQRRRYRDLVVGGDGHRVDQRREQVAGAGFQQLGQGRRFRLQLGAGTVRRLLDLAQAGLCRLGGGLGLLGHFRPLARHVQRFLGGGDGFLRRFHVGTGRDFRLQRRALALLLVQPPGRGGKPLVEFAGLPQQGGAAALVRCRPLGQRRQFAVERFDRLAGFVQRFAGGFLDGGFVALFFDQRFPLVGQAGQRGPGILGQRPFAGKVGGDLGKPALVGVARLGDALFLGVQRLAGDHQPLQRLRRLGFGLPQLRQALGVGFPLGGFRRHRLHVVADGHLGIVEGEAGRSPAPLPPRPSADGEGRLRSCGSAR